MVAATGSGLRNARPALSVTLGSRLPSERSGSLLPIADRGIHFAARALRNSPENRHTKLFALLAPASTRSTPTNSGHYDSFRRRLTESLTPSNIYFTTLDITIGFSLVAGNDQRSSWWRHHALAAGAVAISLGLHAVLLPPVDDWLERARQAGLPSGDEPLKTEWVLPLADWIVVSSAAGEPLWQDAIEEDDLDQENQEDAAKRDLPFVRTTANQVSPTAPDSPGFVSDRNTLASSPEAAEEVGEESLPSVDGEDEETRDVEDRRFRDGPLVDENPSPVLPSGAVAGSAGTTAVQRQPGQPGQPEVAASAAPVVEEPSLTEPLPEIPDALPLPRPRPAPLTEPLPPDVDKVAADGTVSGAESEESTESDDDSRETERLAEAVGPPGEAAERVEGLPVASTPAPSTVDLPNRDVEAFQSETRKGRLEGGAPEKGYAAFDAEHTPIGRYREEVSAAIERAWKMKMLSNQDFMGFNERIRVEFTVNRWGKVRNVRVTKRAKNAVLTNLTLTAIVEAALPEMPAAVHEDLGGGDLPCFYNFRIH